MVSLFGFRHPKSHFWHLKIGTFAKSAFVIVIPRGPWIVCVISFLKIYGLIGWQWSCDDLLGYRGDMDFSCGRVDGNRRYSIEVLADLKIFASCYYFTVRICYLPKELSTPRGSSSDPAIWATQLQWTVLNFYNVESHSWCKKVQSNEILYFGQPSQTVAE